MRVRVGPKKTDAVEETAVPSAFCKREEEKRMKQISARSLERSIHRRFHSLTSTDAIKRATSRRSRIVSSSMLSLGLGQDLGSSLPKLSERH